MITIISGTNRNDSMTLRVATHYHRLFTEKGQEAQLVSLEGKAVWDRTPELEQMEELYFIPAQKIVFVLPEYNGSIPGILKLMMDNSDIKKCWWYKKAMLVGVADGRAGNLRGLDHMTNILNYMKMNVLYNKVPLSRINEEISAEGQVLKTATAQTIEQQVEDFIKF
jgi:chromate reductase, NAD(P)H dehydrogenase (quinone)